MPRSKARARSLPRAAAVLDDIRQCEAELKQLKRLYKLVLAMESGSQTPPRLKQVPPPNFYQDAPVGVPVVMPDADRNGEDD